MEIKMTGDIAIGVTDKEGAADRFARCFGGTVSKNGDHFVEVTAGPLSLYFVEEGNKDIAFSVSIPKGSEDEYCEFLAANGFHIDPIISERVGEVFVRDSEGIIVNVYPV